MCAFIQTININRRKRAKVDELYDFVHDKNRYIVIIFMFVALVPL